MLYQTYQLQDDLIAPVRVMADNLRLLAGTAWWSLNDEIRLRTAAALEMVSRFRLTHERPDFGIETVPVGNREVR